MRSFGANVLIRKILIFTLVYLGRTACLWALVISLTKVIHFVYKPRVHAVKNLCPPTFPLCLFVSNFWIFDYLLPYHGFHPYRCKMIVYDASECSYLGYFCRSNLLAQCWQHRVASSWELLLLGGTGVMFGLPQTPRLRGNGLVAVLT